MSVPTKEQVSAFLTPLRGNLTILLLREAHTRVALGRFLLRCCRLQSIRTAILDTDAFFCANLDRLTQDPECDAEFLLLSEQDFEVPSLLPLVSSRSQLMIIDDLNSLYSLASDSKSSHELMVLMKLLSYNARANSSWVIATAYRTEAPKLTPANQRSLASLGDLSVGVEVRNDTLSLKAEKKGIWPGDGLQVRAYF